MSEIIVFYFINQYILSWSRRLSFASSRIFRRGIRDGLGMTLLGCVLALLVTSFSIHTP
jgi:hypothetical protein